MLAGCPSSTLVSPRHRLRIADASLQFQQSIQQHQQQQLQQREMGTQRFDLPCGGFSGKGHRPPRITIARPVVDSKGGSQISFRQQSPIATPTSTSSSSSSVVARAVAFPREVEMDGYWTERKDQKKRFHAPDVDVDFNVPTKRVRVKGSVGGGHDGSAAALPRLVTETFAPVPEENRGSVGTTNSGSSSENNTVNTHRSCSPNQIEDTSETEIGNGTNHHDHHQQQQQQQQQLLLARPFATNAEGEEVGRLEQQCLELYGLLVACVESLSSGNLMATNHFIARLGETASPEGTPVHRLVAYYTEALAMRAAMMWPHSFCVAPSRDAAPGEEEDAVALRVMNHVTPIPRFMHFTMNGLLMRAFEGKDRVHIIDFDIKQGLQWPGLFQSLASRPVPPTHVRITGIGNSKQDLHNTGIRLAGLAESLGLPFEFHAVVDRFEDVRFWMLHVKEGECVAINCVLQLHRALYDDSRGILADFLGLIRSTSPTIVVVAEQEASHNDHRWEARVAASLPHYAAIFDAVDAGLSTGSSPARAWMEQMFAREIKNLVACEGRERTERHEGFAKWKKVMMEERGGFRCVGVKESEVLQARMLLKMFISGNKYGLAKIDESEDGGAMALTLKWMEQPLYTVSAWAPADHVIVAGSSTASASQRSNNKPEE